MLRVVPAACEVVVEAEGGRMVPSLFSTGDVRREVVVVAEGGRMVPSSFSSGDVRPLTSRGTAGRPSLCVGDALAGTGFAG